MNCWRRASWVGLTGWFAWNAANTIEYSYGENVYYEDNSVYYGDQVVATAEEYADQAAEIVASVPEVEADNVEWMPLGVYSLTNAEGGEPTMYIQLAVSKEGILSGTYQNTATDSSAALEGMVDKDTQRAAWSVVDKQWPVMETGIYNLTESETSILVHFSEDQTQQWLLVRLDDPNGEAPETSEQPAAAPASE